MESFITEVDVLDEARECFLTYSAEVLTERSIPAAEDGLLSSQRKLIWTMEDYLKMDSKGKTKKCNAIVGSTLSTSYYHGDASCYGVLCKMSQKYLMRYPLVHPQGSLGTQEDNDLVASSRYTEAKPSIYADLMMLDYKKNPVPVKETYNGEFMEPVVLPALFPNAICNGRQAIGISMAHNSCPHNLTEVCDAIIAYVKNPQLAIDDIMKYIKGPDFPLKNTIINQKDIKAALATGKSNVSLKVRGEYIIEENKITFTTIPYRAYRNKIKEQLEKNVDEFEKCLEDFNDASSVGENRLIFFAKPGQVEILLNKLFKLTDLQTSISYNMNYIVNGTPKLCSIKDLIKAYVEHQHNVMTNMAKTDLDKAKKRQHILEGLLIAIKDIDMAIQLIKASSNREEASAKLIQHFNITETQANAVLDMKLSKLTKLDKDDLLKELEENRLAIVNFEQIINNYEYRNSELIKKVEWLKNNYGDERRTKIIQIEEEPKEKTESAALPSQKCVITATVSGAIKCVPALSYKPQKKTEKDAIRSVISTTTDDTLLVFTNKCKVHRLPIEKMPEAATINSLFQLETNEEPLVICPATTSAKYVLFITKKGLVKKVKMEEYLPTARKTGSIIATKLREDDELIAVRLIDEEDIVLISANGMGIRFSSKELAAASKTSTGAKGITLGVGDFVVSALLTGTILDQMALFDTSGRCKRLHVSDFEKQQKGGKGTICSKEKVAFAIAIAANDNILIVGNKKTLTIAAKDIPITEKKALGNSILKNDRIIKVNRV